MFSSFEHFSRNSIDARAEVVPTPLHPMIATALKQHREQVKLNPNKPLIRIDWPAFSN